MKKHGKTMTNKQDWRTFVFGLRGSMQGPTPLHQQVSTALMSLLDQGLWRPGDQIPGERELADQFGVSVLTANKAVTTLVRQGRLSREGGRRGTVVPHQQSRSGPLRLAIAMHCSLPQITNNTYDYYSAGILRGIQSALVPLGFQSSVTFVDDWQVDSLAAMLGERLSGFLLVAPPESRWRDINRLAELGIPAVVVGASWPATKVPTVDSDNYMGTSAAIEHLLQMGHTRIGCLYAWIDSSNHRDRLQAFRQYLRQREIVVRPHWLAEVDARHDPESDHLNNTTLQRYLEAPDRPTAVVVTDYQIIPVLMRQARRAGLRLPDDLSIVGFDDPYPASPFEVPLATVEQPLELLGSKGIEKLIALCNGQAEVDAEVLPMRLIVRESCVSPNPPKD